MGGANSAIDFAAHCPRRMGGGPASGRLDSPNFGKPALRENGPDIRRALRGVIGTDPYPAPNPGGTWWRVGVPEVPTGRKWPEALWRRYAGRKARRKGLLDGAESGDFPDRLAERTTLPELRRRPSPPEWRDLQDAAAIGYAGGGTRPPDLAPPITTGLRAFWTAYGVALCGGWLFGQPDWSTTGDRNRRG